jgi:hypothetical protein
MPVIADLYFAMLTKTGSDAGTDSAIELSISSGATDLLYHRFGDSAQEDLSRGEANLYHVDVRGKNIDSRVLVDGDIRVGILGDDAWEPATLFVWGTTDPIAATPQRVIPLAIETVISTKLSTNDYGAVPSMPVRAVTGGSPSMPIHQLLLLTKTPAESSPSFWTNLGRTLSDFIHFRWGSATIGDPPGTPPQPTIPAGAGTDDRLAVEIVAGRQIVVQKVIPDTSQSDLEPDQANMYVVPVAVPFPRRDMAQDSITLSIDGDDLWYPSQLFLFGLDQSQRRPTSIIPLVHIDAWNLGGLSTDTGEGSPQVTLPLLPPDAAGPTMAP